jgi:uncharacterized membrane protein
MSSEKIKKIKEAGWEVGDIDLFLSPEEIAVVDVKLALAKALCERRKKAKITQAAIARKIGSTQIKMAKAEQADGSISMEFIVRSLASLGATKKEIGMAIAK